MKQLLIHQMVKSFQIVHVPGTDLLLVTYLPSGEAFDLTGNTGMLEVYLEQGGEGLLERMDQYGYFEELYGEKAEELEVSERVRVVRNMYLDVQAQIAKQDILHFYNMQYSELESYIEKAVKHLDGEAFAKLVAGHTLFPQR